MSDRVYLDWNATTPLRPEAREAMVAAWDLQGNPSSVHAEGRQARRLVEEARARVAGAIGASQRNVVFTSGGTEANALALTPGLRRGASGLPVKRLLVSAIEHASVLAGGRFPVEAIGTIGPDARASWGPDGRVSPARPRGVAGEAALHDADRIARGRRRRRGQHRLLVEDAVQLRQ